MDSRFDMNYTAEQLDNLHLAMKEFIFRYGYPHMSAPHLTVLELDNGRFMNHSTSPNTDFTRPDVGIAIEDIHDGDEITCNYFEFDKTFIGFHDQASSSPRETA